MYVIRNVFLNEKDYLNGILSEYPLTAKRDKFNHIISLLEHVYMRPEVSSNQFEISNCFEKLFPWYDNLTTANPEILSLFQKLFRLHGDFTAATFQTIVSSNTLVQNINFN